MSKDFNHLLTLISGMQRTDPRTYEALKQAIIYLRDLDQQLNPLLTNRGNVVVSTPVDAPLTFSYTILPSGVQFNWSLVTGAILYEIRSGGTSWDNASFLLRTSSLSAIILPLLTGTYIYRIKSINSGGSESVLENTLTVTINNPDAVNMSAQIIDNNVLLRWPTANSGFSIDYYEITRNGSVFGIIRGNFTAIFESLAGSYTYGITVVDIAGNRSAENTIIATVNQPPDFVLEDSIISNLIGSRVNAYVIPC